MLAKVTLLMQLSTNTTNPLLPGRRIGGWSESYYWEGANMADLISLVNDVSFDFGPSLSSARAAILPKAASVVGQRIQLINPTGPSQSLNEQFPGNPAWPCDIPQMALLCKAPAVTGNHIRQLILRGIPDQMVIEGEYAPTPGFSNRLQEFFNVLGLFSFRGRTTPTGAQPIMNISAAGVVASGVPITVRVGDIVTITNANVLPPGTFVNGLFRVTAITPTLQQFTLANWTAGIAGSAGTSNSRGIVYPRINAARITIGRIIVRKVGRPFVGYRGRRSNR